MKPIRVCMLVLALPLAFVGAIRGQSYHLDPELAYLAKGSNPVSYQVDFSVVVTAPSGTKKLAVWIPVPPSDFAQQVTDSRWDGFPEDVQPRIQAEGKYGNRFAYFEFSNPQGAIQLRHQFQITVQELNWAVEAGEVDLVEQWPVGFSKYQRGERQAVMIDERFKSLLDEIVPMRTNPASDLNSVMAWVEEHFEYDHHDASLRADAAHGLTKRRGHCSDYHSFCASLGRVLGVPTRVTYGLNTFPKNSPSHCKLEAFLPGHGWVSFDVSETQKMVQAIQKSELTESEKKSLAAAAQLRLMRGFRDNTWFLQTRGTDYELVPPAASGPVPVVRTAWIEADGQALPEPDPADPSENKFSWMCLVKMVPNRELSYPFKDFGSLKVYTGHRP